MLAQCAGARQPAGDDLPRRARPAAMFSPIARRRAARCSRRVLLRGAAPIRAHRRSLCRRRRASGPGSRAIVRHERRPGCDPHRRRAPVVSRASAAPTPARRAARPRCARAAPRTRAATGQRLARAAPLRHRRGEDVERAEALARQPRRGRELVGEDLPQLVQAGPAARLHRLLRRRRRGRGTSGRDSRGCRCRRSSWRRCRRGRGSAARAAPGRSRAGRSRDGRGRGGSGSPRSR